MASVNKVILLGNCGKDPEIRYLPSGQATANVSVATTSRRKDKNSGDWVEDTQWHRVVFFDRLAEVVGEYLKKGQPVYVEGKLRYGEYTDKEGIKRYTTDIVATEMQLLGQKTAGGSSGGGNRSEAPAQMPSGGAGKGESGFANEALDDDIPF